MPVYLSHHQDAFPDYTYANKEGLLAIGGDLSVPRLLAAYQRGIFPWFNEGDPICWWCPPQRMVLPSQDFHISRSFKKRLRQLQAQDLRIQIDGDFAAVLAGCAGVRGNTRIPQAGTLQQYADFSGGDSLEHTWISAQVAQAYTDLFNAGYAHCLEVFYQGQRAGGIYGVQIGQMFFAESMFSSLQDGSKVALWALCQHLQSQQVALIDCQFYTPHLASLGASLISRADFLRQLQVLTA